MRPVTLHLGGISDPQVVAALREIERASQDTLQNDPSSSGNAMATLVGAAANQIAYFTGPYTTAFAALNFSSLANVKTYGAKGDGATDDTNAFLACAAANAVVYAPAGTYKVTGTLSVTGSNQGIVGDGQGLSVINSSASGHAILVSTGLTGVTLGGFTLNRVGGPAISGQDGIHFTGLTEQARIFRISIAGFWNNFRLGATSYSVCRDLFSNNAYNDGILATNSDGVAGTLQWRIDSILSQQSNGWGVHFQSTFGTGTVGPLTGWWSFANSLGGLFFSGTNSAPIQGVRVNHGFSGSEGNDSIRLDTYATLDNVLNGVYTEINGLIGTGVNLIGAAVSNVGRGVYATANNTLISVLNCQMVGHSQAGIESAAARALITGCSIHGSGAGVGASGGELDGIYITAGNATITGNSSKANRYGLNLQNDNHIYDGNDFTENSAGDVFAAVPLVVTVIGDNLPATAWTTYTPTVTTAGGNFTTATTTGRYQKRGKTVHIEGTLTVTTVGPASGTITVGLPSGFVAKSNCVIVGLDDNSTTLLLGYINAGFTTVNLLNYAAGAVVAAHSYRWSGTFEVQ